MTRKEKLKLLYELEQRIANIRSHVFYKYEMTGQSENVKRIKELIVELENIILPETIKTN